ncbi:hypothetical protein HY990_07310 [Candidatus Micrarchaeota archaeon]|nr:hypothetical protein [Candidatus Micrarchaeota archaeon]
MNRPVALILILFCLLFLGCINIDKAIAEKNLLKTTVPVSSSNATRSDAPSLPSDDIPPLPSS